MAEPSFEDTRDFRDADRGFIAALTPGVIKNDAGRVVWDIDAYDFMKGECPSTAHPHLWRQGQLNAKQGLFEVAPGIYQVRALDLSNMTIMEGKEGLLIIDPLISCECAAAGLALYREHRGKVDPSARTRRVTGMIYSHSHGDHYMGAGGVVTPEEIGSFPIIAPDGFIEAVMSESILAGPAMRRRGAMMYGNALPRGPTGQIGTGLGMGSSTGTTSLIPPDVLIKETGEELTVDGIRIVFQMVPGSEAPAEINFWFPDLRALCIPETATNCMHNIVTLRGAQVRDAKAWSGYLDEAIAMFGAGSDVMFGSHNWPTWTSDGLVTRLSEQRDLYGFLHDQTVRQMNLGKTGIEIAETMVLPPALSRAWHCRGFYGSLSHNVKGIYQKYMTWFDGNPAHLWQYPPKEEGARYVECFGGVEPLCTKAEEFMARGDHRFAVTLLAHATASLGEGKENPAVPLLADCFEKLGFGAENTTWRNFYLTASQRLRTGTASGMVAGGTTPLGPNLSVDQLLEILAVQLDGDRAGVREVPFAIDFAVTNATSTGAQAWRVLVSNGALTRRLLTASTSDKADLLMELTREQLLDVLRGKDVQVAKQEGNAAVLTELLDLVSETLSIIPHYQAIDTVPNPNSTDPMEVAVTQIKAERDTNLAAVKASLHEADTRRYSNDGKSAWWREEKMFASNAFSIQMNDFAYKALFPTASTSRQATPAASMLVRLCCTSDLASPASVPPAPTATRPPSPCPTPDAHRAQLRLLPRATAKAQQQSKLELALQRLLLTRDLYTEEGLCRQSTFRNEETGEVVADAFGPPSFNRQMGLALWRTESFVDALLYLRAAIAEHK
ncbi:hypothetical protein Sste5344_010426 [Sporothrix stenoceras]